VTVDQHHAELGRTIGMIIPVVLQKWTALRTSTSRLITQTVSIGLVSVRAGSATCMHAPVAKEQITGVRLRPRAVREHDWTALAAAAIAVPHSRDDRSRFVR
jgi:hypothetical protein